jgi:hypothetical protein
MGGKCMNATKNISTLVILVFLLACGQTETQNLTTQANYDNTLKIDTLKQLTGEEKQKQIREAERIDSLRLDTALKDAFKIAEAEFKKTTLPNNMNSSQTTVHIQSTLKLKSADFLKTSINIFFYVGTFLGRLI